MKKFLPLLAGALLLSQAAHAATPDATQIGAFGDWKAYSFMDGKNKVCFMSAAPSEKKSVPVAKKRGDVLLFITHWSGEKEKNVVSVSAGYAYKSGSEAVIAVDGADFSMITDGETAWTKDQSTDDKITEAIRKGSKLEVSGVSKRGTKTTDIYSLKGSADAYDAISKECSF
jgi:hypothetical protein